MNSPTTIIRSAPLLGVTDIALKYYGAFQVFMNPKCVK